MRILKQILCVLAVPAVLATPAFAVGPAIDWDPAYFWQAGATPTNLPAGGEMHIVGIISSFDVPFQDLDANDPTTEYTFYASGLISQGTVPTGPPATQLYTTSYVGGTITIYAGSPRNSAFDPNPPNATVPSTFTDGTPILIGNFTNFVVQTNNFTSFQVGNAEGNITWTGGTLLERAEACPGLFTGGMTWNPAVTVPGYLFRHDGKIDLQCPTPAAPGTWGRIKQLYR
jgi:hypothetical protein